MVSRVSRKWISTTIASVFAVSLYGPCMDSLQAREKTDFREWLPVRGKDLRIKPGSALDFSGLFGRQETISPVVVDRNGKLTYKADGRRLRFMCAPLVFTRPHGGFPEHKAADELAKQLKMHGYNLARLHYIDTSLMTGRHRDFDYDPEQVDRFHYLLAALKKQGVYWMIDAATSWNGAYGGVKPHRFARVHHLHHDVHYDEASRAHWKEMVRTILNVRNKYTGSIILRDPALVIVTLMNESGLGFLSRKGYSDEIKEGYLRWLIDKSSKGRYKSVPERWEVSDAAAMMQQYLTEVEESTLNWMTNFVRGLGYEGLITGFNNGKTLQSSAVRRNLDLVSVHDYYDLPSRFVGTGSRQKGTSSIGDFLPHIQYLAASRHDGKPFIVDEYDHPYWSQWRRESGVSLAGYASLQDWDGICRYANPVSLEYNPEGVIRKKALYPFGIGLDPVGRASETLAALMYRRGDVSPAVGKVKIKLNEKDYFSDNAGAKYIPQDIARLGFITGLSIISQSEDGSLEVKLYEPDSVGLMSRLMKHNDTNWRARLQWLRENRNGGWLSETANNTFVTTSDTGEIRIDALNKKMEVVTANTEAAVFESGFPLKLGNMSIEKSNVPALISLSTLDGKEIKQSDHMLLIVATDAVSSSVEFAEGRKKIKNIGRLPVLIEPVKVSISLKLVEHKGLVLYALGLDGGRTQKLPMVYSESGILLNIDVSSLEMGPTTYFELVREH